VTAPRVPCPRPSPPPSSPHSLFIVIFLCCPVGLGLGLLGEYLVERQADMMKNMENKSRGVLLNSFTESGPAMEMDLSVRPPETGTVPSLPTDHERSEFYKRLVYLTLPITVVVVLGAFLIGHLEGWTVLDTVYWMVVTATTIGYGDESPTHRVSRWVSRAGRRPVRLPRADAAPRHAPPPCAAVPRSSVSCTSPRRWP